MFAGVRLPARGSPSAAITVAQVGGQHGQAAVHLGHRATGRQEGMQAPDRQGEQGGPQSAGEEAGGEEGGGGQVRQRAVERQDHREGQQVADHLARLAIDRVRRTARTARTRRAAAPPACRSRAAGRPRRSAAAPETAKLSNTGTRRRIGPPGSHRQVHSAASAASRNAVQRSALVDGDDHRDGQRRAQALGEADGAQVQPDRQAREVGCSAVRRRWGDRCGGGRHHGGSRGGRAAAMRERTPRLEAAKPRAIAVAVTRLTRVRIAIPGTSPILSGNHRTGTLCSIRQPSVPARNFRLRRTAQ